MRVSLIVAHDLDGVIGRDGALPWHLPDDLARFRALTLGHSLVMGRRTFESIGHALEGRRNVVLSRNPKYVAPLARMASTIDDAIGVAACGGAGADVFVIGGAEVYFSALPFCTRAYITRVHTRTLSDGPRFPCDLTAWRTIPASVMHHERDTRHAHAFTTMTLERS